MLNSILTRVVGLLLSLFLVFYGNDKSPIYISLESTCQKVGFYAPHLPLLLVRVDASEKVLQHLNGRFQQLDVVEFDHAGINFICT